MKILCQLTYQGYVLHHWVWGIEERERFSLLGTESQRGDAKHTHTHTSTDSHLYLFFCCIPAQLSHFDASPLTHSTFQCFRLTPYFLTFNLIHMLRTLNYTDLASTGSVLFCLQRTHLMVNTEYSTFCVYLPVSAALRGEYVVGGE